MDAVIGTLRQDAVPALVEGGVALPDLDDAVHVVLAGASAGGAGVTHNLDRVASLLREQNTGCAGGSAPEECPLVVDGLIDSIFSPSTEELDFEESRFCTDLGACTWEAFQQGQWAIDQDGLWKKSGDASCEAWHAANEPGTEWHCAETSHVIAHHVTTPFFLRMGLVDSLISGNLLSMGLYVGEEEPFDTPLEFATLLQPQLAWFSTWAAEAEEGSDAYASPGVFAPACSKHETISSGPDIYEATIDVGGTPRHFFDIWNFWKAGGATPAVVVSKGLADSVCPTSADIP